MQSKKESLLKKFDALEMNELHHAVKRNSVGFVEKLLKNGGEIANTISNGQTPLHLAAQLKHHQALEALLANQPREKITKVIDRKTVDTGATALQLAVQENSYECTKILLAHSANVDLITEPVEAGTEPRIFNLVNSITAIFKSIATGNGEALSKELKNCTAENAEATMYARNAQKQNALQASLEKNDREAVATLISFRISELQQYPWQIGARFDELEQHSKAIRLHLSNFDLCYEKNDAALVKKETIKLLNSASELLKAFNEKFGPSLEGQPKMLVIDEVLDFFGFSPESKFVEEERLDSLLKKGSTFVAQMLKLCIGVPMQMFMRQVYTTEMLEAAKQKDWDLVEERLVGYPNMNEVDAKDGCTALRYALSECNYEAIEMLLEAGAKPTSEEEESLRESLLFFAIRHVKGNELELEIMQLLFKHVDSEKMLGFVDVTNPSDASTPLHITGIRLRLAQFLMSRGAIYCARDLDTLTPICRYEDIKPDSPTLEMLKIVDQLFAHAAYNRPKQLIEELNKLNVIDLLTAAGARNQSGNTLLDLLEENEHDNEAAELQMILSSEDCQHYGQNVAAFFLHGKHVSSNEVIS